MRQSIILEMREITAIRIGVGRALVSFTCIGDKVISMLILSGAVAHATCTRHRRALFMAFYSYMRESSRDSTARRYTGDFINVLNARIKIDIL